MLSELHQFWFGHIELSEPYYEKQIKRWFFGQDPAFDQECARRFSSLLTDWQKFKPRNAQEMVALIILLDQIPRNSFRGSARAYAYDVFAQRLTRANLGREHELTLPERIFLYMPLEHAENWELQDLSVAKFTELHHQAPPEIKTWTHLGLKKAIDHQKTIRELGRFPKRAKA